MTALVATPAHKTARPRRGKKGSAGIHYGAASTGLYLLPLTAVLVFVFVIPLAYTVWTALHQTSYYEIGEYAGFEAFTRLFSDSELPQQLATTLGFSLGALVIALPAGLFAALLLEKVLKLRRLARAVILLPWLMSQATAGTIWLWFLNPSYGPATYITGMWGWVPRTFSPRPHRRWLPSP
jgi:multiple sugar transport system permease protein